MKTMTVRGIDEHVYQTLHDWAALNHRSFQEQVRFILEREVRMTRSGALAGARNWRRRLQGRPWGDLVQDVREERNR